MLEARRAAGFFVDADRGVDLALCAKGVGVEVDEGAVAAFEGAGDDREVFD